MCTITALVLRQSAAALLLVVAAAVVQKHTHTHAQRLHQNAVAETKERAGARR